MIRPSHPGAAPGTDILAAVADLQTEMVELAATLVRYPPLHG